MKLSYGGHRVNKASNGSRAYIWDLYRLGYSASNNNREFGFFSRFPIISDPMFSDPGNLLGAQTNYFPLYCSQYTDNAGSSIYAQLKNFTKLGITNVPVFSNQKFTANLSFSPLFSTSRNVQYPAEALIYKATVIPFYPIICASSIPTHRDLVSYIYKDLSNNFSFRSFGTRMRIIGRVDRNFGQVANGSSNYFSVESRTNSDSNSINGGSGGIAIMVDPANGSGYYFEIAALTETNIEKYIFTNTSGEETSIIHNIIFYKVNKNVKTGDSVGSPATPIKLWGGLSNIIVDPGLFVGQDRLAITENNTTYDLSIEYEILSGGALKFYLYINNILVQIVNDTSPLPVNTSTAVFVRGSSECMFENLYALEDLIAKNTNSQISTANNVFDENGISTSEFLRKYAIAGMVQSTYLINISPDTNTQYKVYFEEFGTIMRECAHFNIKYDLAYPSFYSKIAKTFTTDRGYTVSKFYGGAYEAEFLVFNSADKAIVLDETTGNYLRILGITFTQNTTQTLSVDKYFNKLSNFSDPSYQGNEITSPNISLQKYNNIKASRSKYGSREFSLESMYIQSEDAANNLMGWVIDKTMKPRRQLTINTFPMPQIQLGDIVTIDYTMPGDIEYVDVSTRFIVQDISYSRAPDGPNQSIKVVEIA